MMPLLRRWSRLLDPRRPSGRVLAIRRGDAERARAAEWGEPWPPVAPGGGAPGHRATGRGASARHDPPPSSLAAPAPAWRDADEGAWDDGDAYGGDAGWDARDLAPEGRGWTARLVAILLIAAMLLLVGGSVFAQDGGDFGGDTGSDTGGTKLGETGSGRAGGGGATGSLRPPRRTREERRSRTDDGRASSAATNLAAEAPAGAAPRGLEQRSRVSAIRGAATASLSSRAPRTNIVFNYKLNERMAVLHFAPADIQLEEGATREVTLVCHNPHAVAADHLRVGLRYNPEVVRLVGLDLMPIRPYFAREPDIRFDPIEGVVTIDAAFGRPVTFGPRPIVTLRWKAIAPTPFQQVEVLDVPDEVRGRPWPSGLYLGARNVLGQKRIRGDGFVPLGFEVLPIGGGEAAPGGAGAGGAAAGLTLDEQVRLMNDPVVFGRGARGGIELELEPPAEVRAGDVFDVPVRFHNPRRSQLDAVRVAITFDPDVLEVVDHDARNAITLGVNLLEGDRRQFPFDYHIENAADNARGRIAYRMGIGGDATLPVEGTLATIRFRARRPARATAVQFVAPDGATPGTRITFLGRDVLGDADDATDGLFGATLAVLR